jgi:hypothetical protein
MITSHPFHVAALVMYQIFSCYANNAIAVSQIVAFVKYIIEELELTAVTKTQAKGHQSLQVNV